MVMAAERGIRVEIPTRFLSKPSAGPQSKEIPHKVTVDLSGATGRFAVEWFNPRTGTTTSGEMSAGGGEVEFTVPFDGDAVLYLFLKQP
jgi:hypothetical protein